MNRYQHRGVLCVSILLASTLAGCGYHLAGRATASGDGQTLAVPLFTNQTTEYRVEQQLTEAVRRELIRRTRYEVVGGASGDVLLQGALVGIAATPVIFTDRGRGTAYDVAVEVSVTLRDTATGEVLFQADRWPFREVFEVANDSVVFVPEDTAAMDRLARQFASSLVASLNAGL
jgi:outer membrane lipopolysaccharide assembly protein LptE/RlpB